MNEIKPLGGKVATGQVSNAEEIARLREYCVISAPVANLPSVLAAPLAEKAGICRERRMLLHRAYIALYPSGAKAYVDCLRSIGQVNDANELKAAGLI